MDLSKKKIVIIVSILSVAVVVALCAMVIVLVLTNQGATSSVKVKYTATDVNVKISASAYVGDQSYVFKNGNSATLELSPTVTTGSMSQTESEIPLSRDNPQIVFEYKFENMTNDVDAYISLTALPANQSNVSIKYYSVSEINYGLVLTIEDVIELATDTPISNRLLGSTSGGFRGVEYVYVVVSIDNLLYDATFSGDFEWNFGKQENVSTITLNNDSLNSMLTVDYTQVYKYVIGDVIDELKWIEESNKRFNGWYLDSSFTTPASFPMTITADTQLYSSYQEGNLPSEYLVDKGDYYEIFDSDAISNNKSLTNYTTLIIPDVYNGKPITAINRFNVEGEDYYGYKGLIYGTNISTVYIGNNVKGVYHLANYTQFDTYIDGSTSIEYVEFGRNTEDIYACLINCQNLQTVKFYDNVKAIKGFCLFSTDLNCFEGSSFLANNKEVTADNNTNFKILLDVDSNITNTSQIANWGSHDVIHDKIFSGHSSLTTATILENIATEYLFFRATALTTVTIGEGVQNIGYSAFYGCTSLTNLTIPSNIKYIECYAFRDCTNLNTLTFETPNGWTKASNTTFTSNVVNNISLSSASENATNFKSVSGYYNYYWKHD